MAPRSALATLLELTAEGRMRVKAGRRQLAG
jgi:hypothetical protein